MKKQYIPKKFGADALELLAKINSILRNYEEQGYDLSLRQLYYQLVAANVVPNTERNYKSVGNLVSEARLAGLIDWDMIKDRGRQMVANAHWLTPREIIEACGRQFQIDKWATQGVYVEVMVEKQALEGVLEPVCRELDVPFTANKGYSSSSALFEAGRRMLERISDGKEIHVVYLGDHDPSGIDMSRDVEERLRLFSEVDDLDGHLELHRVALNFEQIKRLRPPENPAKMTDSRAASYVSRFGRSSWELDAIEPRALATLVRNQVKALRDEDEWSKAVSREKAMRDEIAALAKKSKFKDEDA